MQREGLGLEFLDEMDNFYKSLLRNPHYYEAEDGKTPKRERLPKVAFHWILNWRSIKGPILSLGVKIERPRDRENCRSGGSERVNWKEKSYVIRRGESFD